MALPQDLINPITQCMNPTFQFPSITEPGLPNFVLALLMSQMAGINFVLDFIPPTPQKIKDLKIPDISMFTAPFMVNMAMPAAYPAINISLGGITIAIPGVGEPPYERDLSGQFKFMAIGMALPFLLIKAVVEGLLQLQINLPTVSGIEALFISLCAEVGINTPAVAKFGGCIARGIMALFSALIPV
jgi:hypothetical protein